MPDTPDTIAANQDAASAGADAFSLIARWNFSLASFYARRWQRHYDLLVRTLGVAMPGDWEDLRRRFEGELIADYANQAEALGEISHGAALPDVVTYEDSLLGAQADASAIIEQAKAQAKHILAEAMARAEMIQAEAEGDLEARPAPRAVHG
jgi:cell division septum initiation protein DivIVA